MNKLSSGMILPGNVNLSNRPRVRNSDGSISTVRSMGVNIGGQEVLIPTVSDDGRIMSNEEAIQNYKKTGKHLGMFTDPESSNTYAESLHNNEAEKLNYTPELKAKLQALREFGGLY